MDKFLFDSMGCKYARIRTSPGLFDSRPLRWAGYSVEPFYTYRIDLNQGIDHVWQQFDRKLRVEINKAEREGVTVRLGGKEDIEFIHTCLETRFREQGLRPFDYKDYLLNLFNTAYRDNIKIFIAEYKDHPVGGTINLFFKDIMYLWVGVPRMEMPGISPNSLIQWEAIKWAHGHGMRFYEEMDAGDIQRLRYFKSKYNPDLAIWYSATKYSSIVYKAGEHLLKFMK
jgi:lipid II:glycine glycyltransferase (peptidoglycan interpeptide bridge formation enzyme)